mmetsp:Transcript_11695/g.8533  ORF Transcript_11695/g.8533 Transcript_11695/m.8533 type:complete len:92 (+) Transcript_11695:17-292(+)
MAGYDEKEGVAKLYWMDYLGTLQQVQKGAHGYGAYFVSSVLDNNYQKDMTQEDGLEAVKKCILELKTRFIINQPKYLAKIVNKDGVKHVEL